MRTIILLLQLLIFSPLVHSFELFPMVAFLSDQGGKSEQFYQIKNTSNQPLPLEIFVKQRLITGEEPEQLTYSEDFFVFPPQALIPPGKTQIVKVKYIGNTTNIAKSYRILFTQLPIKDSLEASGVNMLFQIGALAFIEPKEFENKVSAKIEYQDGKPKIIVKNQGAGVITMPKLTFDVNSNRTSHRWVWKDIGHLFNKQFLVPNEFISVAIESFLTPEESPALIEVKGY